VVAERRVATDAGQSGQTVGSRGFHCHGVEPAPPGALQRLPGLFQVRLVVGRERLAVLLPLMDRPSTVPINAVWNRLAGLGRNNPSSKGYR
jgi:hypothetical protein